MTSAQAGLNHSGVKTANGGIFRIVHCLQDLSKRHTTAVVSCGGEDHHNESTHHYTVTVSNDMIFVRTAAAVMQ